MGDRGAKLSPSAVNVSSGIRGHKLHAMGLANVPGHQAVQCPGTECGLHRDTATMAATHTPGTPHRAAHFPRNEIWGDVPCEATFV